MSQPTKREGGGGDEAAPAPADRAWYDADVTWHITNKADGADKVWHVEMTTPSGETRRVFLEASAHARLLRNAALHEKVAGIDDDFKIVLHGDPEQSNSAAVAVHAEIVSGNIAAHPRERASQDRSWVDLASFLYFF